MGVPGAEVFGAGRLEARRLPSHGDLQFEEPQILTRSQLHRPANFAVLVFFGAGGARVRADDGGVQDRALQVAVPEGREDPLTDALLGRAVEPPPGAVPGAEALEEV